MDKITFDDLKISDEIGYSDNTGELVNESTLTRLKENYTNGLMAKFIWQNPDVISITRDGVEIYRRRGR